MVAWFVPILISFALSVVSYVLTPKPKQPKPNFAKELDDPTADAGREIGVLFGTMTIKSPNILWYGEKSSQQFKVSA